MYFDNTGTFDQDIDITSEGEDILEDDNYLAKLLLRELKTQIRNGTFKINICYLPFLNGKQYMNLLRYIVSAGYVESTNSKPEIIHTSDGDFLNNHITLTDKGLYFMKNKDSNLNSSSVTNIGTQINTSGHSAIATGDNSSANLYHQENNGFESVDELIKYLSGLNEYEKPLIASVINDIHQQPENKDNILSKVESFLTNHPKLLTTLTSGTTLIFNNWDSISTSLRL